MSALREIFGESRQLANGSSADMVVKNDDPVTVKPFDFWADRAPEESQRKFAPSVSTPSEKGE